jgi:NNP family nitrate/nitrite transporter-like MFS transporter
MKLKDLKTSGHAPTLFSAFLHFDVSFMIWVILGALAPFLTADPSLTGVNLKVTSLTSQPATLIVKSAGKGYALLVKPGTPATATKASVKPIESFTVDNADPATIEAVNAKSKLIRVAIDPAAKGNPNENVYALKAGKPLSVANGYSASLKLTLVGIPLLAAGFWRILLGVLADRFGSKRVGIASMTVTLLPILLAWKVADSYQALELVGFFLGVSGASFAVALPLASRWYPPHLQGVAMGIAGAGNSGTVMATLFAPMLAKSIGWHGVFGLLAIPVIVTLAIFTVLAKDPPSRGPAIEASDFLAVLRTRDAWTFCLLYFVTFGGFVGLSSFVNTFFVDAFDAPKAAVGTWTWPFIVAGSLVRPIGGALSDRLGGIRMLTVLFAVAAAMATAVALSIHSFAATSVCLFLLMATLGMGNGSVFQLVPQRFRKEIGVITGLVGAAGGIGGYYLNFALGNLHDATGTYATGFLALAVMGVVALAALRLASPTWTWLAAGGKAQGLAVVETEPVRLSAAK